jgi:hypothetical protein
VTSTPSPAGTLGTIVQVYSEHAVYLVEFAAPWHVQQIGRADMYSIRSLERFGSGE